MAWNLEKEKEIVEVDVLDLGVDQTKVCRICGNRKKLSEFYAKQRKKVCKVCWCESSRSKYYSDIESSRKRSQSAYARRAHVHRSATYKRKYKISGEMVDHLIEMQGGKCKCCGRVFVGKGVIATAPVVDHCHKGGHFRGIICQRCNKVEGMVDSSLETIEKIATYIKQNELWYQSREKFPNVVMFPNGEVTREQLRKERCEQIRALMEIEGITSFRID
jgi:hypothetical protein